MKYSVDIENNINSLAYCLNKVNNEIENIWEWDLNIHTCDSSFCIWFNFDIDEKEFTITDDPEYDDSLYLDEIIEKINEVYGED